MHIAYSAHPSHADIDFLTDQLSKTAQGAPCLHPFAFLIREKNKQIRAGVNGLLISGAIYTDQLWVDPGYRNQGLGCQLMQQVHELGRKEKCSMATVVTMSFSGAQKFYEKLGYMVEFIRSGYKNKASCIYLMKKL